jgi:hypothetical protein
MRNRMIGPSLAAATLVMGTVLALSAPAFAQQATPPSDGRFSIVPVEDGFLRLDSRTGIVSECRRENGEFACEMVPDERRAMQEEIDRLATENADLRGRLAARGMTQPGPGLDDAPGADTPAVDPPRDPTRDLAPPRAQLPDDEEVDRALDLMERFMRRFLNIMREEETQRPI